MMKMYAIALASALSLAALGAYAQSAATHAEHVAPAKSEKREAVHKATGVVKRIDARSGTVSIAHEPVKSLSWPSMTMSFRVADKALVDKLAADRKIVFEFEQRGKDYVITSLR